MGTGLTGRCSYGYIEIENSLKGKVVAETQISHREQQGLLAGQRKTAENYLEGDSEGHSHYLYVESMSKIC